jgi:hypothetical protein
MVAGAQSRVSGDFGDTLPARSSKFDEAIDIASDRLAHFPEASLTCPGIAELCQRAGRMDRLQTISRRDGNLVNFLAAKLQRSGYRGGWEASGRLALSAGGRASQMRTVKSPDPDTSRVPSGLQATAWT